VALPVESLYLGRGVGPDAHAALDDWATRFRLDPALRRKLILAASLANGPREPESIVLLALALWNPEHELAAAGSLAVLREGYRLHPGNFWINLHIAMRGAQMPLEDPSAGVLHAQILVSLRPTSAYVRPLLGMHLWRRSQSEFRREDDLTEARAPRVPSYPGPTARDPREHRAVIASAIERRAIETGRHGILNGRSETSVGSGATGCRPPLGSEVAGAGVRRSRPTPGLQGVVRTWSFRACAWACSTAGT
jgi:hypothetical protein